MYIYICIYIYIHKSPPKTIKLLDICFLTHHLKSVEQLPFLLHKKLFKTVVDLGGIDAGKNERKPPYFTATPMQIPVDFPLNRSNDIIIHHVFSPTY